MPSAIVHLTWPSPMLHGLHHAPPAVVCVLSFVLPGPSFAATSPAAAVSPTIVCALVALSCTLQPSFPLPYVCPTALTADITAAFPATAVTTSHTCTLPHLQPMLLLQQLKLQLCGCASCCHRHRHAYMRPLSISPFVSYVLTLQPHLTVKVY